VQRHTLRRRQVRSMGTHGACTFGTRNVPGVIWVTLSHVQASSAIQSSFPVMTEDRPGWRQPTRALALFTALAPTTSHHPWP
jgi:hypothetical protein